MECFDVGIVINNDIDNKLLKSVEYVAGTNKLKLRVLAGYVNSQEFLDYCKKSDKFDSSLSLAENKQNTVRSLLRRYYREKHQSVIESAAKMQAESLQGFSSVTAKKIAINYTADVINITYQKDKYISKNTQTKINKRDTITKSLRTIENDFYKNCVNPLYKLTREKSDKLFDNILDDYQKYFKEIEDLNTQRKETKDKNKIQEIDNQLSETRRNLFNAAYALVNKYGNVIQKNYANLVEKAKGNPNAWFEKAFESDKLISIVKDFEGVLESDKIINENFQDDNDYINPDAESVDESSKSWEDTAWASFDKAVLPEIKLYLGSLYKLAVPHELGNTKYIYDTNNEVGVPVTMGANFVIGQLINYTNTYSVNSFIDDIIKVSQQIPECYGLIAIANRCVNDPVFANKLYTNIDKAKVIKTMTLINENDVEFTQSNKSADTLSYIVYSMLNTTRSTMNQYFSLQDQEDIEKLLNVYGKKKNEYYIIESGLNEQQAERKREDINKVKNQIESTLYNILKKYYPNLNIIALKSYLYNDPINIATNINNLLINVKNFLIDLEKTIGEYNEAVEKNSKAYKTWKNNREMSLLAGETPTEPAPVNDMSEVKYARLNKTIIEIAKKLSNYIAVKNELNSVNAEGNLSSDIMNHSYLSNMIKQIAYSNKEDAYAGLNRLLEEVTKGEQYRYNTLFWGVKNSKGEYLSEGLFIRDSSGRCRVNPNARKLIQVSLFNGIKDENESNSVMYNRMSKGDYFLTNLHAFKNPLSIGENLGIPKEDLKAKFAGYFMRTPSDAPKNFIVQTTKLNAENIITPNETSSRQYLNEIRTHIENFSHSEDGTSKYIDEHILYASFASKITNNQKWNAVDIYKIIKGETESINYNKMYAINNNKEGTVTIPIVYHTNENIDIFWIKGEKIQGETNNILYNLQVEDITSTTYGQSGNISDAFFAEIAEYVKNEGVANGKIEVNVNKNAHIFYGIKQNLKNELNTFIDQLNNVFVKDTNGNWILRKDTVGLIDRAHYNGELVKDGKLTGNFYSFRKLFKTNDYDTQQAIEQLFSLYGDGNTSLLHINKQSGFVNMNNELVVEENNRLKLNINENVENILNQITSDWINNFYKEIVDRSQQYHELIVEGKFSLQDIVDFALNTAVTEMAFDDLFEGDVKFYKDAQDFLKRAKEVQASGTSYTGYDINDSWSQKIKEITDRNNNVQEIKFGNINISEFLNAYTPVKGEYNTPNARNGFRAITIYNTVRPSKYANRIRKEVYDISIQKGLSEKEATRIAQEVYKGYADNTKTNDAQSYITLEEFIRRRYSDGTLNEYEDILNQIYEVRTGKRNIKDLNLAKINARIQVQKNFYFDKKFDTTTRTYYPRQIKNAEFVLIPELLEGTDLKQLYDIMVKYDIGQVNTAETSKAAKKNILTFWDNDGNINANFEQDIIANNYSAIEDYYYRFLYKQQEVPEHMKDAQNKAGIQIMKKILDNADESVAPYVKQFFENYCANIKDSFNKLIFNMGWKVNKDGSLSNIEGNQEVLDFTEFYKRARHEAQRLGLDENFVDYLTPDNFGNPIMPNYMNNVSSKLESIAQAIFNSAITRQTLPGWHAAQVTQIGHGQKVIDSNGKLRELKYHPQIVTKEKYLKIGDEEIKNYTIDALSALINSTYSLKDIAKVVGKTPNNFNAEDYEKFAEEKGIIVTKEIVTQEAYAEVMIPRWSNLIPKDYPIEKLEKEGLDIQIAYRIPTEGKQSVSIVKVVGFLDDIYGSTIMLPDEWVTQTGADFDVDSVYAIAYEMFAVKNKLGEVQNIKKWTAANAGNDVMKYKKYVTDNIDNKIPDEVDDLLKPNKYKQLKARLKKASKEKDYAEINRIGKEAGLMTFNQFKELPEVEKLPRQVRNNNILDAMIKIMESNNSREENYSRSNFDDIVDAMKEMNDARGAGKLTRSTYNIFDQVDFMENAISGASLKAFSVTRDTFNSVNNFVKSNLGDGHEIIVEYNLKDGNFNYDTIVDAYGLYDEKTKTGNVIPLDINGKIAKSKESTIKLRVKHNKLANSNNNRNVVGKLLTVYSSQTTAHILDAIKEGAIFNENEYTFGTFKTLIDTGIDYRTAIAFLMQPAITMINNVNNETNSIYINTGTNAIKTAIKRLVANAGFTINGMLIDDFTSFDKIIEILEQNNILKTIEELFGANITNKKSLLDMTFSLNVDMLKNRLKSAEINNISSKSAEEKTFKDLAFDIAMALTFNKIYDTTKLLENVMRCSNPDRFGAKQTIRNTRMIVDNITEYSLNEDSPMHNVIRVGNKSLLQALYPGFKSEDGIDVENSAYPYLAAFLKYATEPSININSILFPTENRAYATITNAVQQKIGVIFKDDQYREFKQYRMSALYSNVPYLNSPLTLTEEGWIDLDDNRIIEHTENDEKYWNKEISRIYGYERDVKQEVNIENIYNPTKEEFDLFNRLTPAQKVLWIQINLTEDKGIFDFLKVNSVNQYQIKRKGFSQETIRFSDDVENMQEIYIAFNNSFFNTSPIIRSATIDLIKYAFIPDGFKLKKGGLSKIITNNSMYKDIDDMGMNLIPVIRNIFQFYSNPAEAVTTEFIDKFIRSHSEYVRTLRLGKAQNKNGQMNLSARFNIYSQKNGLIFIPFEDRAKELLSEINIKNIEKYKEGIENAQSYIRVIQTRSKNTKINTLYKLRKTANGVYLIPLNLLERNETGDYSVNPNNNRYPDITYFNSIIDDAENQNVQTKELTSGENEEQTEKYKTLRKESIIPAYKFTKGSQSTENENEFRRILENGTAIEKDEMQKFMQDVADYVNTPVEDKGKYILVRSNNKSIFNEVPKNKTITQNIIVGDDIVSVNITRSEQPKKFANSIKFRKKLDINEIPIEQRAAYLNAFDGGIIRSNYYKVTININEDVKNEIEKQDKEIQDDSKIILNAITSDATDYYVNNSDQLTVVDTTAIDIIKTLKRAERYGDKNADKVRRILESRHINEYRSKDIIDNRKNIYGALAQYIELTADMLNKQINHYKLNDEEYNLGDDNLYNALREYPENAEEIVKLLLEAITFGDTFGSIMSLPFDSLDNETINYIKRIRTSIIKVRNNPVVKQGFDKMFNNYIANEYATNPNVRLGLVKLNETFGDAGWWESWIGDIGMIGNKEIQTIVKLVNGIMNQAVMHDAPRIKDEFYEGFDSIMNESGSFNWDNVIDNEGKLIRPYTAQFIEDRNNLDDSVREARDKYGIDSIEYIETKLKRDEWYADNVHQMVVADYYKEKNANLREVLKYAPKEFLEFNRLQNELYATSNPKNIYTKEERDKRLQISNKIGAIFDNYKAGKEKSQEELIRISYLSEYLENKRNLESKYFDYEETEGFKEALKINLDIIKRYEKDNPNTTLEQRLNDESYKSAYEWIKENARYKLNPDAAKAINNAFKILKDKDNINSIKVIEILLKAEAYDDFGNIDARKLSKEDIKKIRDLTKSKYDFSYDSNAGEAILIKDIPTGLPVLSNEFYRMLRDESENAKEINPLRLKLIATINELLGKCIGKDDGGRIHAKNIFEKLSKEELELLAECYRRLKNIKGNRKSKELIKKFKQNVSFETNTVAFREEYAWAMSNLHGTKDFDLFIDIFVQTDKFGEIQLDEEGNYIPNNDIYGYIVPKDNKYIDLEKTQAREIIEDNVEFVPTEYYYAAMHEAEENGNFKEWYKENHVFNPYKHKYEPLRVWTTMIVNPNGSLKGQYSYVPTNDNRERLVKDKFSNSKYSKHKINYNSDTGQYSKHTNLTTKEEKMRDFLQKYLDWFAQHNPNNRFVEEGFIPRKRKVKTDTKWYLGQALGTLGLEYRNDSEDKWFDKVDYANDREIENESLHLLKGKGYKSTEKIRVQDIGESDEDYKKYLDEVKKRNAEIKANNLKIDNALFDKDYRTVFAEAIQQQVLNNAKKKSKNWIYLLQEDIKQNEAYKVSKLSNNVVVNKDKSTDTTKRYVTTKREKDLASVEAFTRRVIFGQFKEKHVLSKYADLARNITSAKYMIFNVTGGIANIGTGFANILGEAFAEDSFTKADLAYGVHMYLKNSIAMIRDMYKDRSNNDAVALTKYFDIINTDDILERSSSETAGEYARRIRNLMYGLQSGGEHYMQNSVLFAVLKGSRIFDDVDGTKRCGIFQQYTWKLEYDTLLNVIGDDKLLLEDIKLMKRDIKQDKQLAYKYDNFEYNFVEEFLRAHCSKDQIKKYVKLRDEAYKKAKEDWNKLPTVIDQFEFKNGRAQIKADSELNEKMVASLKNTVGYLNKKIHGVYDKIGAARIEFSWWGGLVMQYHKHIYPGFMKRFRRKGVYNEQTGTIEIGSYTAIVRLLSSEFRGLKNRIKDKSSDGSLDALVSIQEVFKSLFDTVINIKTNWQLMPQWERNACKRALGDLYGVISALLMSMAIYAMTDDDDEKESEFIATALYISDRLLSESQMYTPWGLVSEASTLWSSPIAASNSIEDAFKGIGLLAQWLFNDDFQPNYKTGVYAGQHKGWVLIANNIPLYRTINRLSNMTKNNNYYRINDKSLNMKFAKSIADFITED